MYRVYRDLQDISGEMIKHTVFTVNINIVFNTFTNCMFYLLANYGFYYCCDFLDIHCVKILDKPIEDGEHYNFEKHGIYVSYPKYCYQDPMVQAFAATILDGINSDCKIDDLFDIRYWLINLGTAFKNASIEKGLFILDALDGTYDLITKEELHLPEDLKADIYMILRWLMREFGYIRAKNNVDVSLKRYRIGEPIAAVYAKKITTGLNICADMGKKVTLYSVHRHINTIPMYVINNIINMSNLIAYRDLVNDNDGMTALKFTYKGISGLGENGTSIQQTYRYVDPSHAGILDLDSSTTSDPGMSGTICPLSTAYKGNSFSEYEEPHYWDEEYKHFQTDWLESKYPNAVTPFRFKEPYKPDYTSLRKQIVKENLDIDKVICPFVDSNDTSIQLSTAYFQVGEEYEYEKQVKSMFTVVNDDDVESINTLEDYDDDDMFFD